MEDLKKQSLAAAAAFIMAASVLAAGCGKKEAAPTESAAEVTSTEESTQESTEEPTEESTEESTEGDSQEEAVRYHMLQGTIVELGAEGTVFTLQADDGNSYDIALTDIRDVEVELAEETQIAIAYIGEVLGGPEAAALEELCGGADADREEDDVGGEVPGRRRDAGDLSPPWMPWRAVPVITRIPFDWSWRRM